MSPVNSSRSVSPSKSNSNRSALRALAISAAAPTSSAAGIYSGSSAAGATRAGASSPAFGKTEDEIEFALRQGIIPSMRERTGIAGHHRVAARLKKIAPIAVRVNPGVDAYTHAKITTGTYETNLHSIRAGRRRLCPREQTEKSAAARPANCTSARKLPKRHRLNKRRAKSCRW